MKPPWRRTLLIFIILSQNNVAVFSEKHPSKNSFSSLPIQIRECLESLPELSSQPQVTRPSPGISPGKNVAPENQRIFVSSKGILSPNSLNTLSPYVTSLPGQTPLSFPIVSTSVLPASALDLPSPTFTLSLSLLQPPPSSPPELLSKTPVSFIPSNSPILVPLTQPQVPIDSFQIPLVLSDVSSSPNFQYSSYLLCPVASLATIVPSLQPQVISCENSLPLKILPNNLASLNIQIPVQNRPFTPYVSSVLPRNQFSANKFTDVNYLPPYQFSPLAITPFSESCAYLPNQLLNSLPEPVTENIRNSQLPPLQIPLQINMPELSPSIISMISPISSYGLDVLPPGIPPFGMSPIVIEKSKSRWKKWLPSFILALFANNRHFDCCSCGGCSCSPNIPSDNVYIPYPIPIPTNNPIICNNDLYRKGKKGEDYDEDVINK